MKRFDNTQLGALYLADPVVHYLYCAMVAAHDKRRHDKRKQILALLDEQDRELIDEIAEMRDDDQAGA